MKTKMPCAAFAALCAVMCIETAQGALPGLEALGSQLTFQIPHYRTDGQPGTGFPGFERRLTLPEQQFTFCVITSTIFSSNPQACTATTPSFNRTNLTVRASPLLVFNYSTRCEAAQSKLVPGITFPGALRLYTNVAVGGTVPVRVGNRTINVPIPPVSVLQNQALGYIARGKTQADVETAVAGLDSLLSDPQAVQGLLGGGGILGQILDDSGGFTFDPNQLSPEQLAMLQQLLPFLKVVSPVFIALFHEGHEACRATRSVNLLDLLRPR
jgi:hypothetical protein